MGFLQRKVKIEWSSNFAYAIGLIASDGCANKDGKKIWLSSKDLELVEKFRKALSLNNKIGKYARGGEIEKRYFYLSFGDVAFHRFLGDIGITPAKSRTIKLVSVPKEYFADFLRGLFDGDGTFYSFWDIRWKSSFVFKLSFASASINFISWLKEKLTEFYGVKGYIHKGVGVLNLEYVKGDSARLFAAMYYKKELLFLNRKYLKMKDAFEKDEALKLSREKASIRAAVAQW